jgi:hydrogenase maturation protease
MRSRGFPGASRDPGPIILFLGNPIVANDQVGLLAGSRLAGRREALGLPPEAEIREFYGSPLDLVSAIAGRPAAILIDSMVTGRQPVGTVRVLSLPEILSDHGDRFFHGMNLAESLALGRRWGLSMPDTLGFIGIEVGSIDRFGESMSPELSGQMDAICAEVERIVTELLDRPTGGYRCTRPAPV